ncbi:MAG TPA: hypothetical protein VK797_17865 [Tepidisphaeraceae bacterium]|jgi:hypothetical protein|nr:hypothetical protein [Tepidisphaeraceae bacterium]
MYCSKPSACGQIASHISAVERLEPRRLLSTVPALTGMELAGGVKGVDQVILSFNESLDPTTAQQPQSFIFGRIPPSPANNGITVGQVLGFLAQPKPRAIKDGKIQWSSAVYNDANHTVTLTAIKPFRATTYFRLLRVKGTGNYAVKDPQGDVLNGGADTLIHWSYHNGQTLRYTDSDGDHITLSLKGPGHIYAFYRRTGDPAPTIFVANTKAKSVLTGTVKQSATGDGVAHIAQLIGAPAKTNLFTSSQFVVGST